MVTTMGNKITPPNVAVVPDITNVHVYSPVISKSFPCNGHVNIRNPVKNSAVPRALSKS